MRSSPAGGAWFLPATHRSSRRGGPKAKGRSLSRTGSRSVPHTAVPGNYLEIVSVTLRRGTVEELAASSRAPG